MEIEEGCDNLDKKIRDFLPNVWADTPESMIQ